ncbi:hypothetical protein OEZ85_005166 [Tetradesmus obliquus]|uniref:Uncharacterized protein n=1 Tax=Tetradesmus obliquus TaxID=3088 RepID=A0ABY8UI48_TETOB|nr:hypothetical protein OEZ85_005166 [Tetradesmus obliquus]
MLPRVTITPDVSGRTVSKNFSSKAKPQTDSSRRKPVHAAYAPAARSSAPKALANVTVEGVKRRSFEKPPLHSALEAPGIQSCLIDADSAGSTQDVASQQALSHTTEASSCHISSSTATPCSSTNSLAKSDSELALLLNNADLSRPGITIINIGSIPIQRKFGADIVATASFANEDTSRSIGRSTVFLRLDVMRSNLLQQLAAGMAGQQQQQLAGAV